MELWLIIAVISGVFAWLSSFAQKIAVERKTDALILILSQAVCMMLLSWVYLVYKRDGFLLPRIDNLWVFLLIVTLSCAQFFVIRVRAEALKYLSSSEYFLSFRVFIVILLTGVWLVLFNEVLSWQQLLWLLLGFAGLGLLFEQDSRFRHSRNWSRALYLLWLSILLGGAIQISAKYLTLSSWDIVSIVFYQGLFLGILSCVFYWKKVLLLWCPVQLKDLWIWLLFGITIYIAAITNFFAFYYHGPVGIVSKILGYSVFVPIILSIIFYDEKMSLRKWVAFALTIISIYYLN